MQILPTVYVIIFRLEMRSRNVKKVCGGRGWFLDRTLNSHYQPTKLYMVISL